MSSEPPNFLTCPVVPELPTPGSGPGMPEPKRRSLKWLVIAVILLVLVLLAPLLYGLGRAGFAAWQLRQTLKQTETHAKAGDFASLQTDVNALNVQLADVLDGLRATGGWRSSPAIGSQIQALEEAVRSGQIAVSGAQDLTQAIASMQDAFATVGLVQPALETGIAPTRSFRDLTVDEKREILARFDQNLPDLRAARDKIHLALEAWNQIPQDTLAPPLRDALAPVATLLPTLDQRLSQAVSLAEVLVPLSGYPAPKTYLVLLQNADELRPTGGFIGNLGLVHVDAGDFKTIQFQDVYSVDGPAMGKLKDVPPAPITRELGVDAWYLRDSNWSPDFPQTSQRLMDVYNRERAFAGAPYTALSGVIALQPGFFRDLLQLTGPLTVEGKTFSADNFFTELEYDVEIAGAASGIPVAQRKEVVAKVGDALMAKLMALPSSGWESLVNLVTNSLDHKDILIFDAEPKTLAILDSHHWTGRTEPTPLDYLWVVDANLAALKTDGVMDKQVGYQVDATDLAGPIASVTLTYHNTNRVITWRYTRYRDYVRVYVPDGSELLSVSSGSADVTHELGKTVFGTFWVVEPGATGSLVFRYRLPPGVGQGIGQGKYQLLVQKQPGANTQLTLDLLFGKKLSAAVPAEAASEYGDTRYRYQTPLVDDQTFDITFEP